MSIKKCPLCQRVHAEESYEDNYGCYSYKCVRCGNVRVDHKLMVNIEQNHYADLIHIASGYCRERTWRGMPVYTLSEPDFEEFVKKIEIPNSMDDKIRKVLLFMKNGSPFYGDTVQLNLAEDYSLTYSKRPQELSFVTQNMIEMGLIEKISSQSFKITYNGWNEIDKIETEERKTWRAFVAMSFSKDMEEVYEDGIKPAIKACGYTPVRVDQEDYNDKIDDFIIAEIKKADFVVADYTQQKHGVYYEAGYAQGYGLPVVWCCREDDIDNCHFDTRQYNHVLWRTPEELMAKLKARIEATIIK